MSGPYNCRSSRLSFRSPTLPCHRLWCRAGHIEPRQCVRRCFFERRQKPLRLCGRRYLDQVTSAADMHRFKPWTSTLPCSNVYIEMDRFRSFPKYLLLTVKSTSVFISTIATPLVPFSQRYLYFTKSSSPLGIVGSESSLCTPGVSIIHRLRLLIFLPRLGPYLS